MPFFAVVALLILALAGLDLALLYGLHRSWWRRPWVRLAFATVPVLAGAGLLTWYAGHRLSSPDLVALGAGTAAVVFVQLVALLVALVAILPLRLAELCWNAAARRRRPAGTTVPFPAAPLPEPLAATAAAPDGGAAPSSGPDSPGRRRFLGAGLAALPLASSVAGAGGIWLSTMHPRLPVVRLRYPDLPADLAGLRILQISDCHAGPYVTLADLEQLLERAHRLRPDLVVVTGDLCDHMPDYAGCLALLEQLRPRLGTFASLGNHEYFRGIGRVRACFDGSGIPLLVDDGVVLPVGDARLRVAGADDPRSMGDAAAAGRLRASVDRALDGAGSEDFQLLMSHRAAAFDMAAGVHLTLAGHTHGLQLGVAGRSLFERLYPDRYLWGLYGGGRRQLYTSAGVGHWFPFRLGCPPEAPLFILENA